MIRLPSVETMYSLPLGAPLPLNWVPSFRARDIAVARVLTVYSSGGTLTIRAVRLVVP